MTYNKFDKENQAKKYKRKHVRDTRIRKETLSSPKVLTRKLLVVDHVGVVNQIPGCVVGVDLSKNLLTRIDPNRKKYIV